MQAHHQQHSYIQRQGTQFVNSDTMAHDTSGTRFKQIHSGFKLIRGQQGDGNYWMLPIFNALDIPQSISGSGRTGNTIFIHRVEVSYTVKEDPGNLIGPDETPESNATGQKIITDPRMRILLVTPKNMYRYVPWSKAGLGSATGIDTVYPYFSSNGDGDHPEPIASPIATGKANNYGMQSLPDPKKYDVLYDDIRNLRLNTQIGNDSGSFSFLVRRQFTYDQEHITESGFIRFQDNELHKILPQIWFYLPDQVKENDELGPLSYADPGWNLEWSIRIVYDNKQA